METRIESARLRTYLNFYLFGATFLPVCFCLLWLLKNTQFPASDATEYLTKAFTIYKSFINHGIYKGLIHCLTDRGWRPIIFPLFTVPFLMITQGSLVLAYKLTTLFLILFTATYVYLYLRLFLDKFSAMLGANLICLLPFIQNSAIMFMAETAIVPLVIGTIYHLVRSEYFTNKSQTIGFMICLTLALLVRPVEAATDLAFVFVVYFSIGVSKRIFTVKQLAILLAMVIATLLIFEFFIFSYFMYRYPFSPFHDAARDKNMATLLFHIGIITCACLFGVMVFIASINRVYPPINTNPIITIFAVVLTIVLGWFAPFAYHTFSWIYDTSIGHIANVVSQARTTTPLLTSLYQYCSTEGLITLSGIIITAIFATCMRAANHRIFNTEAWLYLFLILPFPLWEVLNTCQTETRKLSLAVSCMLMGLLIIGLQRGKFWFARAFIIMLLLGVQFIAAINVIYPNHFADKFKSWAGNYESPITINPNPHNIVLNFLQSEAPKYNLNKITIQAPWKFYMPAYPYLMMMMASIEKHPYKLIYPFYATYPTDGFTQLSHDNDAVMLIWLADKLVVDGKVAAESYNSFTTETVPDLKLFYGFLYYYAGNKLKDIGFKPGPCTSFLANDGNQYKSCLLISSHQKD